MTEVFLLAFFSAILVMGLMRPFLWVLLYLYVDIVSPNKIGTQILANIPMSFIAFVAVFGGWLLLDKTKTKARFGLRQGLIMALLAYCYYTTVFADFPTEALDKWEWVWKSLLFAAFLPMTLTTRLRIESAVTFYVLALATIVINGGVKTLFGGGGYGTLRLLIDNNSGLYESSTIACAAVAAIPLIWWIATHGTVFPRDWKTRAFALGYTFAAILIPVGTSARTGLVCLAVFGLMILVQMKRRALYGGLMAVGLIVSIPFLPASFTDRMSTIQNYESDESASSRLQVWKWTIDYALENPAGGGFNAYLSNRFSYRTRSVEEGLTSTVVTEQVVVDKARAYHSSYFEMLGEQGWFGIGLFLLLHGLGIVQMQSIQRAWRAREGEHERWVAPLALAMQQAHILYLVGSLFVGIAFQPFAMLIIGLQCALWSYTRRLDGEHLRHDLRARHANRRSRHAVTA